MNLEKYYNKAYDWMLTQGPKVILGIVVLFLGLWLINLISKWIRGSMSKMDFDASLKPFLLSFVLMVLRVGLVLTVMQILGIEMTIFAAMVGAFGVAAGLALSGTLQNFASGVLILLLKPFKVGDNILAQGAEGTVDSIQIFYTIITTFDNKTVIIPNSKLSNEVITNISREGSRRADIMLMLAYGADIEKTKSIIDSVIDTSAEMLKTPERRIGVTEMANKDGFIIIVNVWVNAHGFEDTKLAFQTKLMIELTKAGIKLPGL